MSAPAANEFASGWRVLVGSVIGVGAGVSSLQFYSLGIFIKPLAEEFDWTRSQASLGALIGTAAAAIVSPFVGRLADRFGSLRVVAASLLLLAAGFIAHATLISGLMSFLVVTAVMSLLTTGSSPTAYSRLTVTSFVRHRGLALGIVLAGTGLGAILVPRYLAPYVEVEGWRAGYVALGVAAGLAVPLIVLMLYGARDPSVTRPPRLPLRELVGNRGFVPLAVMFLLAAIAIIGTVVQFVPMLQVLAHRKAAYQHGFVADLADQACGHFNRLGIIAGHRHADALRLLVRAPIFAAGMALNARTMRAPGSNSADARPAPFSRAHVAISPSRSGNGLQASIRSCL